jgi:hypothetical protein
LPSRTFSISESDLVFGAALRIHRIECAPERFQAAFGSTDHPEGVFVALLGEPAAPCGTMANVGFLVHGKVFERARFGDVVKLLEARFFLRSRFGDLRFVHIESRDGLSRRTLRRDFIVSIEQNGYSWKRMRIVERRFVHTDSFGELAPENRVRSKRIELFIKIFLHEKSEMSACAARKLTEIFRECAHVLVILRRVKLQRFLGKCSCGPSLIERMIQKMVLFDEVVNQIYERFLLGRFGSGQSERHCGVSPVLMA